MAGDCIEWGYGPNKTETKVFNSCIRMARADYAGQGWSATRYGTKIQPYFSSMTDVPDCFADCNSGFEANWNEQGAYCISHWRWKEFVARVVAIVGLDQRKVEALLGDRIDPSDEMMQEQRPPKGVNPPGEKKKYNRCISELPLLKNRSEINSCSATGTPVQTGCGNPQNGYDPACKAVCP